MTIITFSWEPSLYSMCFIKILLLLPSLRFTSDSANDLTNLFSGDKCVSHFHLRDFERWENVLSHNTVAGKRSHTFLYWHKDRRQALRLVTAKAQPCLVLCPGKCTLQGLIQEGILWVSSTKPMGQTKLQLAHCWYGKINNLGNTFKRMNECMGN